MVKKHSQNYIRKQLLEAQDAYRGKRKTKISPADNLDFDVYMELHNRVFLADSYFETIARIVHFRNLDYILTDMTNHRPYDKSILIDGFIPCLLISNYYKHIYPTLEDPTGFPLLTQTPLSQILCDNVERISNTIEHS